VWLLLFVACEPSPGGSGAAQGQPSLVVAAAPAPPQGPNREVVVERCLACHSPGYIAHQPPLSRAQWTAVVMKMKSAYGAPLDDAASAAVVDYLVAVNGAATPP
jgi:hypothetical protein